MKKSFGLSAAVALGVAMTGSAFAAPTLSWSGNVEGDYTISNTDGGATSTAGTAVPGTTLNVGVHAEDTGNWTLDAKMNDLSAGWNVGLAKLVITQPSFTFTAATGGDDSYDLTEHVGPVGILSSTNGMDNKAGGFELSHGNALVQLFNGNENLWGQYTTNVSGMDLGMVATGQPGEEGTTNVGGWVTKDLGNIAISGEAFKTLVDGDNTLAYGAKVTSDGLLPHISTEASMIQRQASFVADDAISGEYNKINANATYADGPLTLKSDYTIVDAADTTKTLNNYAVYSGEGNTLGVDDLFDMDSDPHYNTNVAPAARVDFNIKNDASANPETTLKVRATAPVIADRLWAIGSYTDVSDADKAEDTTTLAADAYYQLNDKLSIRPNVTLANNTAEGDSTTVKTTVNYAVTSDANIYTTLQRVTGVDETGADLAPNNSINLGYSVDF